MKKIFILALVLFTLVSCGETDETSNIPWSMETCNSSYLIWDIDRSELKLKGVIINDGLKTVSSPMAWVVNSISCNAWKEVYPNTLIAQISPDFNNPNTVNFSIQKGSLVNQKINLESIKASTISSFDNQISNLREQIIITEKNIELTKSSSSLNKNDLEKQILSLENTLTTLESSLELAKRAKVEALEKIDISRESLSTSMISLSGDNLLKIDEVFWITEDNKDSNDKYDDYLSAKNSSLANEVRIEFIRLNNLSKNINSLSNIEISDFLWGLVSLNETAREAVKESIPNVHFPQTQIDGFYLMFLTYSNNLAEIKSWWDSLENSKSSITTSYDTQILSLQNQIDTTNTSLDNLKTNKLEWIDVWLDLQLSNLDSGLKTLNSNLENLLSTRDTQVLSLENQIIQINQSIASLSTNLSVRNVYAGISWVIKQKMVSTWNNIWANTPLCQILPNTWSTKIKIYSPVELDMWDKLIFDFNNELYEVIIENVLVYKDQMTQNYIYESNYLIENFFKDWEILNLTFENNIDEDSTIEVVAEVDKIIKVPLWYVKNKINWNFLKINSDSWVFDVKVELWDINWNFVEIKQWLDWVVEICK